MNVNSAIVVAVKSHLKELGLTDTKATRTQWSKEVLAECKRQQLENPTKKQLKRILARLSYRKGYAFRVIEYLELCIEEMRPAVEQDVLQWTGYNYADAQDILQRTSLTFLEKVKSGEYIPQDGSLLAYYRKLARGHAANWRKQQQSKQEKQESLDKLDGWEHSLILTFHLFSRAKMRHLLALLQANLSHSDYQLIRLMIRYNRPRYAMLAEKLGVSEGAIRQRSRRIKTLLNGPTGQRIRQLLTP